MHVADRKKAPCARKPSKIDAEHRGQASLLEPAVPTIDCDSILHTWLQPGLHRPVVKPLLRSPQKPPAKAPLKAVLSSSLADTRARWPRRKTSIDRVDVHSVENMAPKTHNFTARRTADFNRQNSPANSDGHADQEAAVAVKASL